MREKAIFLILIIGVVNKRATTHRDRNPMKALNFAGEP